MKGSTIPQARESHSIGKGLFQVVVAEFREDETTKQGSRTAGEPLVNTDDGAVVLLDLLLPERPFAR